MSGARTRHEKGDLFVPTISKNAITYVLTQFTTLQEMLITGLTMRTMSIDTLTSVLPRYVDYLANIVRSIYK